MKPDDYTWFSARGAIVLPLLMLLTIGNLTACNDSRPPASKDTTHSAKQRDVGPSLLEHLQAKVLETTQGVENKLDLRPGGIEEKTVEEIEKLFRWEYKVIDIPPASTTQDFEASLNLLGGDGWECFHIDSSSQNLRATCKRRPRGAVAYLKLLPGL